MIRTVNINGMNRNNFIGLFFIFFKASYPPCLLSDNKSDNNILNIISQIYELNVKFLELINKF